MRVLIVNTYPDKGGAAVAAKRLAQALYAQPGVEVSFLTLYPAKTCSDDELGIERQSVIHDRCSQLRARYFFVAERAELWIRNGFHRTSLFDLSPSNRYGFSIVHLPIVRKADIIHLHWVHHGFLAFEGLAELASLGKPIVYTMHDQWIATQAAHHQADPNVYQSPWSGRERSWIERVGRKKQEVVSLINPTIIGCSHWIANRAQSSYLTKHCSIVSIPNTLNCKLFAPTSSLPSGPKELLMGAVNSSDRRKGFEPFREAAWTLQAQGVYDKDQVRWCLFGNLSKADQRSLEGLPIRYLGYVSGEQAMAQLYQNAYATIVPSLQENLPNLVMESLACGTPVIAFQTGGIPEMIVPNKTGTIVPYGDSQALAQAIADFIQLPTATYQEMRSNARDFVLQHYTPEVVAPKHVALYQSLLSSSRP